MNYFNEIEIYIKKNEISKKVRKHAKYGNQLIKKWSNKYLEKYGNGYNYTNMSRFRQFYLMFPILAAVRQELTWTHIKMILPIKNENKRNYYINLCITKNLSSRELQNEIKNQSYERLVNKPEKIEIINTKNKYSLLSTIKDPIIIELEPNQKIQTEHDLEISILAKLQHFFNQLGEGFALIGNQYKVNYYDKNYYIDILLFNVKLNCYVVVELKLRELRKEDKSQIEFYMKIIDEQIKEPFHNKTIGIIISKQQDKLIANFVSSDTVIPLTYKIQNGE